MATRVLGPTGSRRRRRFLFVSLILVACTALFLAGSAQAVHEFKLQLDGDVSTKAYTVNDPSLQVIDWGANTCNVADTVAPATCTTGIAGQTDTAHSIFLASRNQAGTTESVAANPATVGTGKAFDTASFQRDFESGATCTLSSTSTTRCGADDTTYSTGSKDTLGIANGGWQCGHSNNVNNKVDINNAYIASFWTGGTSGTGDHILYAGVEKEKNNGTNDIGVWFLQGSAECLQPSGPNINWTGTGHRNGDVLLVSEFSNGGGVSTVKTFTWRASTDPASPFFGDGGCIDSRPGHFNPAVDNGCNLQQSGGGGDCKGASVNDTTCATTNAEFKVDTTTNKSVDADPYAKRVSTPWLASDATLGIGNDNVVSPDYIEMGINITKLFAGSGEAAPSCFSVGVPDTRSSPSVTATLFDYVVNQIGECHTTVTTTPVDAANHANAPASSIPAAPADAQVNVQDKAVINVTGVSSFSGSIAWHICGATDPSSSQLCDGTTGNVGVDLGTTPANSNGDYFSPVVHITAAGRYCFRAEFSSTTTGVPPGSDSSANECFTIAPVQPLLPTQASVNVEIGGALNDTATLGPTAKQPGTGGAAGASPAGSINPSTLGGAAQGTITFKLWGPAASPTCSGNLIATRVVAVNGSGSYSASQGDGQQGSSGSRIPSAVGTYYWTADYSGDLPNTKSASSACGAANESATVVDARISITPTATNRVGSPHTFTVLLEKNPGTGWVAAANETVTVTLTPSNGATPTPAGPFTGTTDAQGHFAVTFTSAHTGLVDGNATSTLTVGGVQMTRTTGDAHTGDGPDAVKTFVDAKIEIAGTATNRVGTQHTFTVTLWKDLGDGNGFVRFSGAHVDRSLQDKFGATSTVNAALTTCGVAGPNTDVNGQCLIVINSNTTGQVVASASWTGSILGSASFTVSTDGTGLNSGPATKTYIDAKIEIAPSATNGITEPHTFTATLWKDLGDGNGFVRFSGAHVDVTLTDAGGAVHTAPTGTCTNAGPNTDVNGQCTISFTSNTAGTVTGHASWTGSILGSAQFTVSTGSGAPNSADAVKTFVQGSLSWIKRDGSGNLLGGATFQVCATGGTAAIAGHTPTCVTVVDNGPFDANPTSGQFKLNGYQSFGGSALGGLAMGTYTIQETAAPPGYQIDPFVDTVTLTVANPNGSASHVWVNTQPGQGCTPGFWKNHQGAWDNANDPTVIALKAAIDAAGAPYAYSSGGGTNQSFATIFGLSAANMSNAGLSTNLTLLEAIQLNGGGYKALARHGSAALLSSVSVQYPYTAKQVLDMVHGVLSTTPPGDPTAVTNQLAAANNLNEQACPTG